MEEDDEEENGGPALGSMLLDWAAVHPQISAALLVVLSFTVVLTGYQNVFVIPDLRQKNAQLSKPHPLTSLPLQRAIRSEAQIIQVPRDCLHVSLWLELGAEEDFPAYLSEVVGESNSSFEVSQTAPADYVLRFLVSCSDLPADKYILNLYGMQQGERVLIDRIRFEASRQ